MKIDMSPEAITMRLKQTSQLRRLCIALADTRLKKKWKKQAIGDFSDLRKV